MKTRHIYQSLLALLFFLSGCENYEVAPSIEGIKHYNQGSYEDAIKYFDSFLRQKPDFEKRWSNMDPIFQYTHTAKGNAFYHLGKFREAKNAYEKSLEIGDNIFEISWLRKLSALLDYGVKNEVNYFNLSLSLYRMGEYERALEILEKVEDAQFIAKRLAKSKILIAQAEMSHSGEVIKRTQEEKYNKAMDAVNEILRNDDTNCDALIIKALILQRKGEKEESLKVFKTILDEEKEENFIILKNDIPSIEILIRGKKTRSKFLGLDEKELEYFLKAQECVEEEKYQEAIQIYDSIIQNNANVLDLWLAKGDLIFIQGKYDEALESYENALELNPDSIHALWRKAVIFYIKDHRKQSIVLCERIVDLDNMNIIAKLIIGLAKDFF